MLSITLFGSETWSLTEDLRARLHTMYAYHVRGMARVSLKHMREQQISTEQLASELGIAPIGCHIEQRQLRSLGHVSRMSHERLPRRMLSSWVPHPRPPGAPPMTYGRSVTATLSHRDIDVARWPELAADRNAWRTMLSGETPPEFRPVPLSRRRGRRRAAAKAAAAIECARRHDVDLAGYLRALQQRDRAGIMPHVRMP